ncbi:MAG: hypothetical protein ACRELB_01995 [Polyangiaceae bacterium]
MSHRTRSRFHLPPRLHASGTVVRPLVTLLPIVFAAALAACSSKSVASAEPGASGATDASLQEAGQAADEDSGQDAGQEASREAGQEAGREAGREASTADAALDGPGSCVPDCTGKACGADDGCGGHCQAGTCGDGLACRSGTCKCDPNSGCGGCCGGDACEVGNTSAACGNPGTACAVCSGNTECGYSEPQGGRTLGCYLGYAASCGAPGEFCVYGYTCDAASSTCKVDYGGACGTQQCASFGSSQGNPSLVCDPSTGACAIAAGQPCDNGAGFPLTCVAGYGCDENLVPVICRPAGCIDPGGACTTGSVCCDTDQSCIGGVCAKSCTAAGQACNSNGPCCSGGACVSGTCTNSCVATGGPCTHGVDCCSQQCIGAACSALTCTAGSLACTADAECCSGLGCTGGRCACVAHGAACTSAAQCCDAAAICQGPSPVCCIQTAGFCNKPSDCCSGACSAAGACQ